MNYNEEILNLKKIKEYLEHVTTQLDTDNKSDIGDLTEIASSNIRKAIIKLKKK